MHNTAIHCTKYNVNLLFDKVSVCFLLGDKRSVLTKCYSSGWQPEKGINKAIFISTLTVSL
ncbi:hypothetical protein HMPREF0880_00983 [Yokenella regensburgei ATCC 43003]|nr:hypothetical protein HMPREF0880_00983 [Yokenella regensburgei ATCC 43003]